MKRENMKKTNHGKRICLLFFTISIILVLLSFKAEASPAYEDFTTYTEVDPNTKVTVTATRVTLSQLIRNEATYVCADKGAGHFGNFEHLIDVYITDVEAGDGSSRSAGAIWSLSNTVGTVSDMESGDILDIYISQIGSTDDQFNLRMVQLTGGVVDGSDISGNYNAGTALYLTIDRTGTTVTCKIYTDASRTTLDDTLTFSGSSTTYRYLEVGVSIEATSDPNDYVTFYVENLDLQEEESVENSVTLNSPSDEATETSWTVDFNYTPTFYQTIQNASLWLNVSGTWQRVQWNSTAVTNNTENTISYTFSSDGTYIWNVEVFNSTDSFFAGSNWTVTVPPNSVTLNSPTGTETSLIISFNFTPTFYQAIQNASIYTNETGNWALEETNNSAITNGTSNIITHTLQSSIEGTILWNVGVWTSTNEFFATSNATFTLDTVPLYQNVGSNATSMLENGTILLYGQGYDRIGLDAVWLATNETGNWFNYSSWGAWTNKTNITNARADSSVAVVSEKLYLIGGYAPTGSTVHNNTYCYDPFSNSWSSKADIPDVPIHTYAATACSNGTHIFVWGGLNGVSHKNLRIYSVSTDSWSTGSDFPVATGIYSAGCIYYNDKIYIAGGVRDALYSNSLTVYDPSTDLYDTSKTSMPGVKGWFSFSEVDGKLYAIGGGTGVGNEVNTNYCYDVASDSWSTKQAMPISRWGLAREHSAINGKIYVTHGMTGTSTFHKTAYVYNPASDSWRTLPNASYERDGALCGVIGDKLYVVGGRIKPGGTTAAVAWNEVYDLSKIHNSPLDLNQSSDTWIWSNFTWSNSSITAGTTIGWRIYYNDTYGNENKTDIMTFTVKKSDGSSCSASIECLGGYCCSGICQSSSCTTTTTTTTTVPSGGGGGTVITTTTITTITTTTIQGTTTTSTTTTMPEEEEVETPTDFSIYWPIAIIVIIVGIGIFVWFKFF